MKKLYLAAVCFFLGIVSAFGIANVKIAKFTNPNICSSYPSAFVQGSFSITETRHSSRSGFSAGQTSATLIIGFSNPNFRFNPNTGTITATGTEVSIESFSITATSITVTITTAATNKQLNAINFNNIEINSIAAATGFIARTGGTFKINNKATFPASTVSWGDLTAQVPLKYSSSIATQAITLPVFTGINDNQILGVQVVVTGTCSFLTATSFGFATTGSSNPSTDITNAKLYYTGVTNVFLPSPSALFGSVNNPNGAFTINGTQALNLGAGTYYFWLTYDIPSTATNGNIVDAVFNSVVVSGSSFTPTSGNPTGSRTISSNVFYSIADGNWSNTIWSLTSGGPSCSCAPTGGTGAVFVNHAVTLNNNYTVDRVTVQPGGTLTNAPNAALTVRGALITIGSGIFSASSLWNLNIVYTTGTGTSSFSAAVTIAGPLNVGAGSTLQVTGGVGLTINGNLSVDGTLALGTSSLTNTNAAGTVINGTGKITGSGTITLGGVDKTIPDGSNLTIGPKITISGSVTVINNATVNAQNDIAGTVSTSTWTNGANSVLNMGGASLMSTGKLDASAVPNTVNYNGSDVQTIKNPNTTYYNLSVANSSTKSLNSNITVDNNILISSAAQLNGTGRTITLNNNWINNSTNPTPYVGGTVSFNGEDTIYGSGITTFNAVNITANGSLTSNSSPGKVIVTGSWTNDGDFDGNNSDVTFALTTSITGSGVPGFNTIIVNAGATVSVNIDAEIDIGGNLTANGTFSAAANKLVLFNGSGIAQNVNGNTTLLTLSDVEIDNEGGQVLLSRPLAINGSLTLTNGNLNIAGNDLTFSSSSGAVVGSFSAATMIVASGGGAVIKNGTSGVPDSFTFPVGDNIGIPEYSPITLSFTNKGSTGFTSVKVTNAKHPNNVNTTNFLNRYWTVVTSYSSPTATVTATYADADIVGTEANILMGRWTGTKPWTRYASSINTTANTLTSPGITSFAGGDFTGINSANPTVSISFAQGSATACQGSLVTLQANATGDPTITYSWNPGGATTQTINPSTSTAGTTNYTVTVTDGNGFTSLVPVSQNVTVVVSTTTANAGSTQSTCSNIAAVSITGASATNQTGVSWSTSGTGTFTNGNTLAPTYSPGAADIAAGSVTLTLTATDSTCTAASAKTLTITAAPTANAGTAVSTCSNSGAVNITAEATATNQAGVAWTSSGTGIFANVNSLTTATYAPSGADITAGSVTLTLTATGNAPCANALSTKTLTIALAPAANAGADQTDNATCGFTQVILAGSTPVSGQTGLWTVVSGTGGSFGNASSPASTFSGIVGGTYILRWTISSPPCTPSSDDMVVTFNTDPTVANANPTQRVCGMTSTNLTANTPVNGTGTWSFAPGNTGIGGSFGDVSNPSSSFSGVEGQVYTLRWTITTPCNTSSDNVSITFAPEISTPPFLSISKKDVSSCGNGSDGILKGFVSGGSGDYTWTFTGGTQQRTPDSIVITNLAPSPSYALRVRDNSNNCTAIGDTSIILLDKPRIEVSVLGNISSCDDTKMGFFAIRVFPRIGTIATGLKPFSFELIPPNGDFTPQISAPFKYSNLPAGTYQVVMTDSAGCVSDTLKNITIGKDKPFTVDTSGYHHPSCLGNDGDITVIAHDGSNSTYRYSISKDGDPSSPTQSGRIFGSLGPGNYMVIGSDSRECKDTLNFTLKTNTPTITKSVKNVSACGSSDGSITVRPSGGIRPIGAFSLSTDNGQSFTKDQTTQIFTGLAVGSNYAVRVTDAKGCMSDTITNITIAQPAGCKIAPKSSISTLAPMIKNSLYVQVFPNPSQAEFTLIPISSSKARIQIFVTNMFGKKLYQATGSVNQQYVFGKQFISGMYMVQVMQGKEIRTLKLIKGK